MKPNRRSREPESKTYSYPTPAELAGPNTRSTCRAARRNSSTRDARSSHETTQDVTASEGPIIAEVHDAPSTRDEAKPEHRGPESKLRGSTATSNVRVRRGRDVPGSGEVAGGANDSGDVPDESRSQSSERVEHDTPTTAGSPTPIDSGHIGRTIPILKRLARSRVRSADDREEVVQDTLLTILEKSERAPWDPSRGTLDQYVCTVFRSTHIGRSRRRGLHIVDIDDIDGEFTSPPDELEGIRDILKEAMTLVPKGLSGDAERLLLLLVLGHTGPEIEQELGWSERHRRTVLNHVRDACRRARPRPKISP